MTQERELTVNNGRMGYFVKIPVDTLFNIVAGPGKWDLLTAFGNAYGDLNGGQTIEFQYFASDSRMKIH